MKTDSGKTDVRDLPGGPHAEKRAVAHLHQAFDIGRLDNEVEPPKILLDIIHAGVAVWGVTLAAGVYFFGGQDWRESLLVIGVFTFFLGAWRIAMFFGARRKKRRAEAPTTTNPYLERSTPAERGSDTDAGPIDRAAETRRADASAESTAAEREYVSRSS